VNIWCQWPDLKVPQGWTLHSKPLETLSQSELATFDVYVPPYMSGAKGSQYIEKMPNLKVVQLLMAGFDDALGFMRDGQTLCNARSVHDYSTAELAITFMLSHYRKFADLRVDQNQSTWNHYRVGSLAEKRIGIIGAGSIANTLKSLLSQFPVEIELYGRSERAGVYSLASLAERAPQLDVLVLLVPLTPETRGLIGAKELSSLKDGALLINVARGPVVDSAALIAELARERIYAALDVTDPEPLPSDSPLWRMKNCTITPHTGGDSTAFEPRARKLIFEQLERITRGDELINIIDWKSQ
jgi:phosphoglycerate dehydrogenase-like enzyme